MSLRSSFTCIPVLIATTLLTASCAWCATAFSDDFSRDAVGQTWTVVDDPSPSGKSAWTMGNGKLAQSSNIYRTEREYDFWQGTHIVAGDSFLKDYTFSAECASADDDGWGVIVRYQDKDNYYRFITVADPGNRGPFRRLEKFVSGERTVLAEDKKAFEPGKKYKIELSADRSKLTLRIDGETVLSATDDTFASGKVGFLTYADSGFIAENALITSSIAADPNTWEDDFKSNTIGQAWAVVDDPSPSGRSAWIMSNGTLTENSNIYRTEREYEFWQGTHITAGDSSWTDYEFTANCTSGDDDGWGMIVRYKDKDNYYRFITVADGGNGGPFRRLEKFLGGKRTVLAEDKKAFEPGKKYSMRLSANGSSLVLQIDGKTVFSATDDAFGSGKVGFLTYANSGFAAKGASVKLIK